MNVARAKSCIYFWFLMCRLNLMVELLLIIFFSYGDFFHFQIDFDAFKANTDNSMSFGQHIKCPSSKALLPISELFCHLNSGECCSFNKIRLKRTVNNAFCWITANGKSIPARSNGIMFLIKCCIWRRHINAYKL